MPVFLFDDVWQECHEARPLYRVCNCPLMLSRNIGLSLTVHTAMRIQELLQILRVLVVNVFWCRIHNVL